MDLFTCWAQMAGACSNMLAHSPRLILSSSYTMPYSFVVGAVGGCLFTIPARTSHSILSYSWRTMLFCPRGRGRSGGFGILYHLNCWRTCHPSTTRSECLEGIVRQFGDKGRQCRPLTPSATPKPSLTRLAGFHRYSACSSTISPMF